MRLNLRPAVALVVLILVAGPAAAQTSNPVSVHLELSQEFFYEGEPMPVRISVRNDGPDERPNPVSTPLFKGFQVRAEEAGSVEATGKLQTREPTRPEQLAPRSFYGAVLDISELFPGLREPGIYRIHWSGNGLLSEQLTVRVIPKYDPSARYAALIQTSMGSMKLRFFPDQSPIAVKAFIDMANAGFYDGLLIHEIRPDAFIAGGSPQASGVARKPFLYPAEASTLPLVAGTVVLRPVSPSPPANGPEFMILLRPQPTLTGQATVLGQVVTGLEVAQEISKAASSGQIAPPFFKPVKDITIEKIKIIEDPTGADPAGSGTPRKD